MTGAALGDRYGRRNLYAVGLASSPPSSAACALAPDVGWLIAARAVQGAGAALLMPLGLALPERGLPARAARCGDRDLQRDHRAGRGQRPARRRRRRRGPRLAVDLLDQRPDRAARRPARADPHDGELRARHQPRHPRPRPRHRRRARPRLGAGARQPGRLGQPRGARRRWPPAPCSSRPSSPGSCARASRCCRWASSARAPSRRATRRSSSRSRRCSAPCSSTRSCCRPGSATARSAPACGCCRGRRRS